MGFIGDIGGHGLCGDQAWPLAHQNADHLAASQVSHIISGAYSGVFHIQNRTGLQSLGLQALGNCLGAVHAVGQNRC